jgi:UDP-N-acetylmuramoyl-L-alanyl-D-glutamate--2,6-diaminopimelate ligase
MRLQDLCRCVEGAAVPPTAHDVEVRSVRDDSRAVEPGDLFVAVPGENEDGRDHVSGAVAGGAVAIVSETPLDVPVPVVLVPDARAALAELAAESLGRPARRLRLAGMTGTLGKTSVLTMLAEILRAAELRAGTVGSLGINYEGYDDATPNTTPGAVELQRAMAGMVEAGVRIMAMEVTSHALVQGRVHGLRYDLGVFTNLAMLEHMEYHGSFRDYARAKLRFLRHLKPDAPLVYAAGDRAVRTAARQHPGPLVSCGGGGGATVTVRRAAQTLHGTRLTLNVRRPLPRVDADPLPALALALELRMLGRSNVSNAALAAVAGLCLGASPDAVRTALAALEPPRRRMQVLRRAGPAIIDDTVGHPDSITSVFEVAQRVPHRRLHIVFCIRGQRGALINERDAEALVIWSRVVPVHTLITTTAADTADERNTVAPAERAAFLRVIERTRLRHTHCDRLEDAVAAAARNADEQDLVLLLGAQGMDAGAALAARAFGNAPAH